MVSTPGSKTPNFTPLIRLDDSSSSRMIRFTARDSLAYDLRELWESRCALPDESSSGGCKITSNVTSSSLSSVFVILIVMGYASSRYAGPLGEMRTRSWCGRDRTLEEKGVMFCPSTTGVARTSQSYSPPFSQAHVAGVQRKPATSGLLMTYLHGFGVRPV